MRPLGLNILQNAIFLQVFRKITAHFER